MIKNVTVFDSEGKMIGMTYPKRAAGLVKNGRARYYAGLDGAGAAIILAGSPETAITSQEDEIMSNFNSEELRAKIEELMRETKEKVEALCRRAENTIEDLSEEIEEADEELEDGDLFFDHDGDAENTVENKSGGRWISDEDMEKLKARMSSLRESFGRVTEEMKTVAVKTGAEIGKYAEAVKTKVTEKLAEREAEAAAAAEASKPGSEAYYLEKIAAVQADKSSEDAITHLSMLQSHGPGDVGTEGIAMAIGNSATEHERTNQQMLAFYTEQLKLVQSRMNESADSDQRKEESPEERRARLISNDPVIRDVLNRAASNPGDSRGALEAARDFITEYIVATYGDPE